MYESEAIETKNHAPPNLQILGESRRPITRPPIITLQGSETRSNMRYSESADYEFLGKLDKIDLNGKHKFKNIFSEKVKKFSKAKAQKLAFERIKIHKNTKALKCKC